MVLAQVGNRDPRFVEEQSWYGVRRAVRKHLSCNVLFAGATRNYLSFPVEVKSIVLNAARMLPHRFY
jgi:hypothetical protein